MSLISQTDHYKRKGTLQHRIRNSTDGALAEIVFDVRKPSWYRNLVALEIERREKETNG